MRKIKFRGKRVDNGEWVEGDLIQLDGQVCIAASDMWGTEFTRGTIELQVAEVIPDTLGQFTGLHDKDGKEIWEWDAKEGGGYCIFMRGKFVWNYGKRNTCELIVGQDCTVIGNIHDNPELLKPQDNDNTGI